MPVATTPALLDRPLARETPGRLLAWVATGVVGLVFLLTEHSWTTSLAEAYTSTEDQMEAAAGGGNMIRRLMFLTLGGLGLTALSVPAARRCRGVTFASSLLGFFAFWCVASVAWSIDPGMTIRRLFVLACWMTGAVGLARMLPGRDFLRMVITIGLGMLALGLLAELSLGTFRPQADDYRFAGTQHPNTTALSLSTLCLAAFCLWRSERKKLAPALLFMIALTFLMLTKSRTSAAGVLVALMFLWTLSTPTPIKAGVGLVGLWAFGLAAVLVLLSGWDIEEDMSRVALMGREEQSESLTGRIPIWTELGPYVGRRLFLGYGYDSFWIPDHIDRIYRELQWPIREAHSSYVDLALSVGVVAGGALVIALILGMRRAAQLYLRGGRPEHGFAVGLQLYCFINALTESAMVMPLFIPFVAACATSRVLLFDDHEHAGDRLRPVTEPG
ncbi:MAG: O-antigen ligase family protein [Planctomycetaceae bacterium]|nr:O-antigen ligase family protein [Planctomycetaceae bacterium]